MQILVSYTKNSTENIFSQDHYHVNYELCENYVCDNELMSFFF